MALNDKEKIISHLKDALKALLIHTTNISTFLSNFKNKKNEKAVSDYVANNIYTDPEMTYKGEPLNENSIKILSELVKNIANGINDATQKIQEKAKIIQKEKVKSLPTPVFYRKIKTFLWNWWNKQYQQQNKPAGVVITILPIKKETIQPTEQKK